VISFYSHLGMHELYAWLGLAYVHNCMRCLSKNRLDTKLRRKHLASVHLETTGSRCARALRSLNHEDTDTCTLTITSILFLCCVNAGLVSGIIKI